MLAGRVADFRSSTQTLLPPKVLREWLTMFVETPLEGLVESAGQMSLDAALGEATAAEGEGEGGETAAAALLHERELDDYLCAGVDWAGTRLSAVKMPSEAEVPLPEPLAQV